MLPEVTLKSEATEVVWWHQSGHSECAGELSRRGAARTSDTITGAVGFA